MPFEYKRLIKKNDHIRNAYLMIVCFYEGSFTLGGGYTTTGSNPSNPVWLATFWVVVHVRVAPTWHHYMSSKPRFGEKVEEQPF